MSSCRPVVIGEAAVAVPALVAVEWAAAVALAVVGSVDLDLPRTHLGTVAVAEVSAADAVAVVDTAEDMAVAVVAAVTAGVDMVVEALVVMGAAVEAGMAEAALEVMGAAVEAAAVAMEVIKLHLLFFSVLTKKNNNNLKVRSMQ